MAKKKRKRKVKTCGAKTRKGGLCEQPAMKNGRCHYHGGKSTGPPKGSKNAAALGIYADGILPSEANFIAEARAQSGQVEEELAVARLQLRRCLVGQKLWLESRGIIEEQLVAGKGAPQFYDLESVESELIKDAGGKEKIKRRMLRRRHDFTDLIVKWLRTIAKLETTRSQIISAATERGLDASVLAEELRAFGDMALLTVPATE